MSLDYPLYQEMVRRNSRGRRFWRIGDCLYYLGLLSFVGSPVLFFILKVVKLAHPGAPDPAAIAAVFAGTAACVFILGGWLKGISYTIAKKEGIDISKY